MKKIPLWLVLVAVATVLLGVNMTLRWRTGKEASEAEAPAPAVVSREMARTMLPTMENLPQMGMQWQRRLEKMPPEQRVESEARLREETRFFVQAFRLPSAQRETVIRERLETLMNDPMIQAEWFDERINMLVDLSPEQRGELLRDYVREKKKIREER